MSEWTEYSGTDEQIDYFGYIQSSLMNDSVLRLDDDSINYSKYDYEN